MDVRALGQDWEDEPAKREPALPHMHTVVYEIVSAMWGNEARDAAVVMTPENGAVAISAADTSAAWAAFVEWQKTNPVAPLPAVRFVNKRDVLERRLGMTIKELKALLAE